VNLTKFKKVLIIRLSSLGDILLTTPLIRTLKNLYPQLNIDFIIREEYQDTIRLNPHINNIITINRNYNPKEINKKIKNTNYDLIIDLQNNFRSRSLTRNTSTKIVRYKKPYLKRMLLVKFNINKFNEIVPIPVRYASAIPNFNLDNDGLELFLSPIGNTELNENDNFIGLCPGSRHKTKMWPTEYFIKLGKELNKNNFKVILLGGKDDRSICKVISDQIENSMDLSNNNNLLKLAEEMKKCKAVVCNDSGLMHTALAVGVPTIGLFGSTVKEFGFAPYKGKNLVLENNSLSCRPCSHIGLDECPKKHLKCLKDIDPNFVLKETLNFVNTL
jgi:heptosyltransferase-2